jgi:TRAP-type C4-dicarboxylate transport system substrate-binding protein
MFKKGLLRGYDNVVVLSHFTTGVYYLHTSFPVGTPGDIKGHKFRATNKFHADMYKHLGAIGVGMPIPKAAENISRGVIEGTICDMSALVTFRIIDAAKHHLMVPLGGTALAVVMNKQKFEGLPAKAQAAIMKHSGEELVKWWCDAFKWDLARVTTALSSDPAQKVVKPTGEELMEWKKSIQPVIEAWKKGNPKREELIKAYQEELAKIRSAQ